MPILYRYNIGHVHIWCSSFAAILIKLPSFTTYILLAQRLPPLFSDRIIIGIFVGPNEEPNRDTHQVKIFTQTINEIAPIALRQFRCARAFKDKCWRAGFSLADIFRLNAAAINGGRRMTCLLYTSPSPRDATLSRMPSSA